MFAFSSKLLSFGFIVTAPVLAACTAATGSEPGDTPGQFTKYVSAGIETTVALRASPASKCSMSTDGAEGHSDDGTVETDADGLVQVSVLAQGEEPFTVTLDCDAPGRIKATYSYELKAVSDAMQEEKIKAK
jgi:hypothetical protein